VHRDFVEYDPIADVLDESFLGRAIFSCLKNNNPEGIIEVISGYLEIANKVKFANNVDLSRSTLYHSLKKKNPTIKTLAKLVSASFAQAKKPKFNKETKKTIRAIEKGKGLVRAKDKEDLFIQPIK